MAVEKMSFINIAGPLEKLDSFIMNNILPCEVEFVKTILVLDSVKGLSTFTDENPYEDLVKKMEILLNEMSIKVNEDSEQNKIVDHIDLKEVEKAVDYYHQKFQELNQQKLQLEAEKTRKEQIKKQVLPIKNLKIEVDEFFDFQYMKFRFGKMPKDSFIKLKQYVEKLDVIVYDVFEEENEIFLIYFMPNLIQKEIDSLFASLYFKRIRISGEVKGHPKEALKAIDDEILLINSKLKILKEQLEEFYNTHEKELIKLYYVVSNLDKIFDVRRYAARSDKAFYLTGWIADSSLKKFKSKLKKEEDITCIIEDEEVIKKVKPPTKLKNNSFFKPFELLVSMYGTPSYNEIDPTAFVAITYMLLFGLMFGDVGQGLVIALGAYFIYKKKNIEAAKIGIYLGICSMITGLFYGSIFGNEEIIPEHLHFVPVFNPMLNKNVVLIAAVSFGVILITLAMILNIVNSIKSKRYARIFLDKNGFIGLLFYYSLLFIILEVALKLEITAVPAIILIICSLLVIMFSHPLQNLIERKKDVFPSDKTGFFIESIFELIETILSVLSNTISFIRVGAFALNHVGFFMAFHMLADLVGHSASPFVMIFGNILIIGLEGLIVFIQGLRLEYYELFSRFFEGNGTEFRPFKVKRISN